MKSEKNLIKDDAYYDELLKKRVGEALSRSNADEPIDLETLQSWAEADKRKKALKRRKYVAAAASFVLICAAALGLKALAESPTYYAVAGNGNTVINESGDSTVVKNNEEGVKENLGEEIITIKKWNEVLAAKKEYPDLMIPEYVPEGYEFKELKVEGNRLKRKYTYYFEKEGEKLLIIQSDTGDTHTINDYDYCLESKSGKVYITMKIPKTGGYIADKETIIILGEIEDNEYIRIVDFLKR